MTVYIMFSNDNPYTYMIFYKDYNYVVYHGGGIVPHDAPTVIIIQWYNIIISVAVALAALFSLSDSLLTLLCVK